MTVDLRLDTSEINAMSRAIGNLPGHMKAKVFASAMTRMSSMVRTRIVKRSAERIDVSQAVVRSRTTAHFNSGNSTIMAVIHSGWIPLYLLGARQTSRGVAVRLRGSYKSAFLATMKSGHSGVFKRAEGTIMRKKNKQQIRELFGPNPAHDVTNNPEVFVDVLAELIENHLAPRILHELDRQLPR